MLKLQQITLLKDTENEKSSMMLASSLAKVKSLNRTKWCWKTTSFYTIVGLLNQLWFYRIEQYQYHHIQCTNELKTVLAIWHRRHRFRKLSVEDNIRCVLELTKMSKSEQQEKTESLLENSDNLYSKKSWRFTLR